MSRLEWLCLALVLLLAALLRLGLVDVPLERDEGEYAYAGQLILQGEAPYRAVHNMKLPGIYAAYAVILKLFGQTHLAIHRALILVNGLTALFLFLLARRLLGAPWALAAAACFLLLSAGQAVEGVFANAEHFVILFAIGGLCLLLTGEERGSAGRIAGAGALLGMAFIMKQHGIAFGIVGAAAIASRRYLPAPAPWRAVGRQLAFFTGGWIGPYLGVCLLLYLAGAFGDFWFWTVTYARSYVSQIPLALAWQNFYQNGAEIARSGILLWILAALGALALPFARIARWHKDFMLLLAGGSLLAIVPGFFFRPHYFVLLLPAAALLAGLGLRQTADWLGRLRPAAGHAAAAILLVAALGQSLHAQSDYFFTESAFQVARSTYWLNPFHESLAVADYVRANTEADDRIVVLGSEPQIYFYAQRRSVNGFIYMYPLMETHAFALEMQQRFVQSVAQTPPKYVILVSVPTSWLLGRDSHKLLLEWFDRYRREHLQLVGMVELYDDHAEYRWDADVRWPAASRYWVAVFKNTKAGG